MAENQKYLGPDIVPLIKEKVDAKQDKLVSGENIKTVNGHDILGEGNIVVAGSTVDALGYSTEDNISQNQATKLLYPIANEDGTPNTNMVITPENNLGTPSRTVVAYGRNNTFTPDAEGGQMDLAVVGGSGNKITGTKVQGIVEGINNTLMGSTNHNIVFGSINKVQTPTSSSFVFGMDNDTGLGSKENNPYNQYTVLVGAQLKGTRPGSMMFGARAYPKQNSGHLTFVGYQYNDNTKATEPSSILSTGETDTGNSVFGMNCRNAGTNNTMLGNGASTGNQSDMDVKYAVAVGTNSHSNKNYNVSVGNENMTRTISYVSAGVDDTDAVNVGQLKEYVNDFEPETLTVEEFNNLWENA